MTSTTPVSCDAGKGGGGHGHLGAQPHGAENSFRHGKGDPQLVDLGQMSDRCSRPHEGAPADQALAGQPVKGRRDAGLVQARVGQGEIGLGHLQGGDRVVQVLGSARSLVDDALDPFPGALGLIPQGPGPLGLGLQLIVIQLGDEFPGGQPAALRGRAPPR